MLLLRGGGVVGMQGSRGGAVVNPNIDLEGTQASNCHVTVCFCRASRRGGWGLASTVTWGSPSW